MPQITPADEFAHTPAEVPNWQENYVWHAWNPRTRCGWNLHLANLREAGLIEARGHVIIDGVVTAGSFVAAGAECFDLPGLDVEVEVPLERLRIRFGSRGVVGPDRTGWFGVGDADQAYGLDIEMVTGHPVFDAFKFPKFHETLDVSGSHYEAGARWAGTLWSGDRAVSADGLLVRDHSWGGRAWTWDEVYWVPMVFDGGAQFRFNWCRRSGGDWRSMSVHIDGSGAETVTDDFWVRLGGTPVPRRFWLADVLRAAPGWSERGTLYGDIHLPVKRSRSGSHAGLSDLYSTVRAGGLEGFSTVQLFPTDEQVASGFANPLPRP